MKNRADRRRSGQRAPAHSLTAGPAEALSPKLVRASVDQMAIIIVT